MSAWDNTPSDVNPEAVASFDAYMKARRRFEAGNVIPFRPRQMAQQQLQHDLANAFRSMELAKRDDGDKP